MFQMSGEKNTQGKLFKRDPSKLTLTNQVNIFSFEYFLLFPLHFPRCFYFLSFFLEPRRSWKPRVKNIHQQGIRPLRRPATATIQAPEFQLAPRSFLSLWKTPWVFVCLILPNDQKTQLPLSWENSLSEKKFFFPGTGDCGGAEIFVLAHLLCESSNGRDRIPTPPTQPTP